MCSFFIIACDSWKFVCSLAGRASSWSPGAPGRVFSEALSSSGSLSCREGHMPLQEPQVPGGLCAGSGILASFICPLRTLPQVLRHQSVWWALGL